MTEREDGKRLLRPGGRAERIVQAAYAAALALYQPGQRLPPFTRIAERAGVQKTTLYRRWKSPEALLHEAMANTVSLAIPVQDTGTLEGDLQALARHGHAFLETPEGRDSIPMLVAADAPERAAYWERRYASVRPIFERAVARGELAADAPWQAYMDAVVGVAYFQRALKGEPADLATQLFLIARLCRATPPSSCDSRVQAARPKGKLRP